MNGAQKEGAGESFMVLGEAFTVEEDGGRVFLVHPRWSMVGMGRDVEDARADLVRDVRMFVQYFDDGEDWSEEGRKAYAFAKKLAATSYPPARESDLGESR